MPHPMLRGPVILLTTLFVLSYGEHAAARQKRSKQLAAALIEAARYGRSETVRGLLDSGADPDDTNSSGMTALHYAAKEDRLEIAQLLLAAGADVDSRDDSGRTPLLEATSNFDTRMLRWLLEQGATPDGKTLSHACWVGRPESVAVLLDAGVHPSHGLYSATCSGGIELVRLLVKRGADVNAVSATGHTALHGAAAYGRTLETIFLLNRGADPEARTASGCMPLYEAVDYGNWSVVRLLLNAGASLKAPDTSKGLTPLRLAATRGAAENYQWLLKQNGGVETPPSEVFAEFDRPNIPTIELIDDLYSDDETTEQAACLALLARGSKALPDLIKRLRGGPEKTYGVLQFLPKMGPDAEPALPQLASLLTERQWIPGIPEVMEKIRPGSFHELPRPTRVRAAAALIEQIKRLDEDTSGIVLWQYLWALVRMKEVAPQFIVQLLRSENVRDRGLGAGVFREFPINWQQIAETDATAIETELVRMLKSDPNEEAREAAATALSMIRPPNEAMQAAYRTMLRDPNSDDRTLHAAAILLSRAGPHVIEDFIPLLTPIDNSRREVALEGIQRLNDAVIPRLGELLNGPDEAIVSGAIACLAARGRNAVPALTVALLSGDALAIQNATLTLSSLRDIARPALPALLEIAGSVSHSDTTRLIAVQTALRIDSDARTASEIAATFPVLIKTLKAGETEDQLRALKILQQIGPIGRDALPVVRRVRAASASSNVSAEHGRLAEPAALAIEALERTQEATQPQ